MMEGRTGVFTVSTGELLRSCSNPNNIINEEPGSDKDGQEAKMDAGKPRISLVPPQIMRDIAEVRMFGCKKYKDPDNWKRVEKYRYVDAMMRHLLCYLEDENSVDNESGIKHIKHAACNMAFILQMEKENDNVK